MNEIRDEAYTKALDEIARLNARLYLMSQKETYMEWQRNQAIVKELKTLVARAADALEKYTEYPIGMVMSVTLRESGRSVLAELRKAVQ